MSSVLAILGGSGLYDLPGLRDRDEHRVETPFGTPSDPIVSGRLGDTRVLFLARHGRGHRIPPHRIPYQANVYALKQLGATHLVSVSAVGSLRESIAPGDFVVVDQYVDLTRRRASTFFDDEGCVAHVSLADPVDAGLSRALAAAAERAGGTVHRGGAYLCIEGPQFSTRAESHFFRSIGAAVIGMTNAPEYKLAREAELPFATLAMATDYDCWHEGHEAVTVEQVMGVMAANAERARRTLANLASSLMPLHDSPARKALDAAVVTADIPAGTRERLAPLLARLLASRPAHGDASS